MGTPREPDTGVSGNGGDAVSRSNGKKKENRLTASPMLPDTPVSGSRGWTH
ncbi:hypothetical protein GCM10008922_29770 [Faecalicatena contorta]